MNYAGFEPAPYGPGVWPCSYGSLSAAEMRSPNAGTTAALLQFDGPVQLLDVGIQFPQLLGQGINLFL